MSIESNIEDLLDIVRTMDRTLDDIQRRLDNLEERQEKILKELNGVYTQNNPSVNSVQSYYALKSLINEYYWSGDRWVKDINQAERYFYYDTAYVVSKSLDTKNKVIEIGDTHEPSHV